MLKATESSCGKGTGGLERTKQGVQPGTAARTAVGVPIGAPDALQVLTTRRVAAVLMKRKFTSPDGFP